MAGQEIDSYFTLCYIIDEIKDKLLKVLPEILINADVWVFTKSTGTSAEKNIKFYIVVYRRKCF